MKYGLICRWNGLVHIGKSYFNAFKESWKERNPLFLVMFLPFWIVTIIVSFVTSDQRNAQGDLLVTGWRLVGFFWWPLIMILVVIGSLLLDLKGIWDKACEEACNKNN